MNTVFCDTSVLIRYFAEDDAPRALASAALIDGPSALVVSTAVILEAAHVLRTEYRFANPVLAELLIGFLARANVSVIDTDKAGLIAAIAWTQASSARRIADAIVAKAAELAGVDYIATFDEKMSSPRVPVRML
jgi:predicted nucleic-acid-binding protein